MELSQLPILAGSVATTIFVGSYLPMLARALRTRDLSSYSRTSLVLANVGNLVQTLYVLTLPAGPIWGLHMFYLVATLVMLVLHLRHTPGRPPQSRPLRDAGRSACHSPGRSRHPGHRTVGLPRHPGAKAGCRPWIQIRAEDHAVLFRGALNYEVDDLVGVVRRRASVIPLRAS